MRHATRGLMTRAKATFFLSAFTLLLFTARSSAALDPEADRPYQFQVVLHLAEQRMLTAVFKDRLERELRDSLQAALGDAARVKVVTQHPLLKEIEAKGLEAALDSVPNMVFDGKTHFVRVGYADGRYRIAARQLDGLMGMASPIVRREETTDRLYVARAASLLIGKDFGAIGTVTTQDGAADVRIVLKAGKLAPMGRWVKKGDVFAVAQIQAGSDGLRAERVPWSMLRVEEAPTAEGVCRCRLWQRYKQSLAGGPSILGYRCARLGTARAHLRLRLVDDATRKPLPDQSVTIRRMGFEGPAEEEAATDAEGSLVTTQEYEQMAFVQVQSGTTVRARIPLPILDARALVIPVSANPAAEARNQFELRRRQWHGQLYESLLVVDHLFQQLNKLVAEKKLDEAVKKTQAGLDALKGELAGRTVELKRLRNDAHAMGQENPDLSEGEQRIQEMQTRRDELQKFADNLKVIMQAGQKRKELLSLAEQARLFEGEFQFGKAIETYQQIAAKAADEPALLQAAEARRAELEKSWTTRGDASIQRFVFETWPKSATAAELKPRMEEARKMFEACRDANDKLTLRMLLKANLAHANRLDKRLKSLQPKDREDDRREAEDIAAVAALLDKLTQEVSAYLRGAEKK